MCFMVIRDVAKRKKWGVQKNFFKTLGNIETISGCEGGIYKVFKSWGGGACKTLFFNLMIFFLKKNTDFLLGKNESFQKSGGAYPPAPRDRHIPDGHC